jgi:hypothetical protein
MKVIQALPVLSVTVRQAVLDVRKVKASNSQLGDTFDNLNMLLKAYNELFVQVASNATTATKVETAFMKVYIKGYRLMNELAERANEQIRDAYVKSRYGTFSFVGLEQSATYENVNNLLDDLIDFETDGGFAIMKEKLDEFSFIVFKGLAKSFTSHVLNNKYLLAIGVHDDMLTMIENVITAPNEANIRAMRRFKNNRGTMAGRNKLPRYTNSERVENPPPDATKIVAPRVEEKKKVVGLQSSFKKLRNKKHKLNTAWYSVLDKSTLKPEPKTEYVWVDLRKPLEPHIPQYTHIETNVIKKSHYYDVRIADMLEYHEDFNWDKLHIANLKAQRNE